MTQKPSLLSVVDKVMLLNDGTVSMFGERDPVLRKLAGRKAGQVESPRQGGTANA